MRDPSPPLPYRADIDGLRALSVVAVVAFHAVPAWCRGGFVGVDIFFVISGFLITSILLGERRHWAAGVRHFYGRRVRRIFPALILVLAATLPAAWWLLLPDEFVSLGRHLLAGAGFGSNFLSWSESGYFDTVAEKKILLHLWSLAIEEQFYLVWPLAVLVLPSVWRKPVPILLVAGGSFALALVEVRDNQVLAFFSPLTRAWELLAGACLAANHHIRTRRALAGPSAIAHRWCAHGLSAGGALLILAGIALADPSRPHPSWLALLPVLGACALIAAGPEAMVNRGVLARPVAVAIGRISYPLYLWHWPLLAFAKVLEGRTPDVAIRLGLMAAACLLAALTWVLVERPVQRRAAWHTVPVLLILMGLVGGAGLAAVMAKGWPDRAVARTPVAYPGDVGHEAFHGWIAALPNLCQHYAQFPYSCHQTPDARAKPTLALLGDSHAQHLAPALAERLPGMNVTVFGVMGLPGIDDDSERRLIASLASDDRVGLTLVVAAWFVRVAQAPSLTAWQARLSETLLGLRRAGRAPVLLEDVPHFTISPERCRYRALPLRGHQCDESRAYLDAQRGRYLEALREVARVAGVPLVEIADRFCDAERCWMQADGKLLYRDSDHLGIHGARRLVGWLTEAGSGLDCTPTRCSMGPAAGGPTR